METKILVVDDEVRNLRLLEAMLIPLDYTVLMAQNGETCLKMVEENKPDLILLDLMLPTMSGYDVLSILKKNEQTKLIPVVIVTALNNVEKKAKALILGADDFLTKPVDKIELKARVQSSLKVKAYNDHMQDYSQALRVEVEQKTAALQSAINALKLANLDTLNRLGRAAEYKDEQTGVHIQRISYFAAALARNINLPDNVVEDIFHASSLHDVGKIGIPDNILLKAGKLTSEEWEVMKQHTTIGAKILAGSSSAMLQLGEEIALTHHERWDGSGYPRGLGDCEIPLVGRIVAIADVFDALLSKRPYKEPLSLEKAFEIIEEGRGNHFDPDLVDVFLKIKSEIIAIDNKLREI